MHLKKVKRLCGVKGCRNTDCYCLSKSAEIGTSVIICKDCITKTYDLIVPKPAVQTEPTAKKKTSAAKKETEK